MLRFHSLAVAAIVSTVCAPGAAQDTVHLSGSGGGKRVMVGRVLDYTGQALEFEHPGGRREQVPGDKVLRIETPRGRTHEEADAAFEQGDFDRALALYERAIDISEEPRVWVRREILAQMVRCYRATQRIELAARSFLMLLQSDPQTPDFDCIPLAWVTEQPSPAVEQAAQSLLANAEPAAALIGASYLMSTSSRTQALGRLRRLAGEADPRIALLAAAQLWRAAAATADAAQVDAWQQTVERIPEPLRAGPYYVLGQARMRRGQWEQAALALMRAPLLYPGDRRLAAASLVGAGRALEQLGRRDKALRLYRELLQTYPEQTRAVDEARQQLQKAGQEAPR